MHIFTHTHTHTHLQMLAHTYLHTMPPLSFSHTHTHNQSNGTILRRIRSELKVLQASEALTFCFNLVIFYHNNSYCVSSAGA